MSTSKLSFICVAFTLISIQAAFAQNKKLDNLLKKIDGYYREGNFPKAQKTLKKFKSKSAKLGTETNYQVTYFIEEARLNLASGLLATFNESLENAVKTSEKIFGETSLNYATTLAEVASVYNEYGNFRLARTYAEKAEQILERSGQADEVTKANLLLVKAEALIGQGFCNEAIQILNSIEPFFIKRAVEKETIVDGESIKTVRVPNAEVPQRFQTYATVLTLYGHAYGKKGSLISADSAFLAGRAWIEKNRRNMGLNNLTLARHNYLHAVTLIENGNESREKDLLFDNILGELKMRTAPTHSLAHDIYLAYLRSLLDAGNQAKYNNVRFEYEKILNKYFPKNSVVHANLSAIELDSKLHKDKTKNLESLAFNMLSSKSVPKMYRTTEDLLEFLIQVALIEKRYANAENYFTEIATIKKELYGETSPEYHLARIKLANFYLDYTNKIDEAGKIYQESYLQFIAHQIGDRHKDLIQILNHLAKYYEVTDQYKLANEALIKAKDAAWLKYDKSDPAFAIEQDYLADLMMKIGMYEEAEQAILIALKILEEKKKDDRYLGAYIHAIDTQAKLYGIKGLFDEAEDNLELSSKLISKAKVHLEDDVTSTEELAVLFIQLGRYSDADEVIEKQIPEYEKLYGKNSLKLIEPLVSKGRILLARGEYTEAERIASRAHKLAVDIYGDVSTKTAPTQKLLSDIYYTLGDYEKAELNIDKALKSQEKQFGRMHIEVAKSLAQLGLIKFYRGDKHETVEKLLLEARDIMEVKLGKENPQYAEILKSVAVIYIAEKKYDIAFNSLTIAEAIWRKKTGTKNNINAAAIYTLTGDVYYQLKNYKQAEEFYNKSKNLYEKFFSSKHPEYVKVLSKLSKVYYMQKDFKRAKRLIEESLANYEGFIKLYFPALSEREKAKYWNTIRGDFEFYNTLAFSNLEDFRDLTGKVYNYQLLTKALLLSSSIKIRERILKSSDEELKSRYTMWVERKEMLTLALSMSSEQLAAGGIDPNVLQHEVEALEKELSQRSELFGESFENKKVTFEEIRKSLQPNEVAMEMVRYRHFDHTFTDSIVYAALYLKPELSKPKAILFPDGKKMESRYFKFYRNAITGGVYDPYSYDVFWKRVNDELGQTSTIYLSADGIYNQINLEAIPTPDGKYIIDNSNIVLVSNTRDIFLRKVKKVATGGDNTASMFGNPKFYLASAGGGISNLPGTEKEVSQLQFLLKEKGWITSEYVEDAAAEENIKGLNSPKIFHIATHGLYTPSQEVTLETELQGNESVLVQNPLLRTGLLLKGAGDLLDKTEHNYNMENGILTAYEAMSLNLDRTDLVVLSACETGLGDIEAGEGVYGLQRAFLVAGAKVLVMSMFKVDDEATQKLMLKFYQKWLNSGNMRQSFTEAKKELRVDYPEPIHWGAFMMIGLEGK